MSWQTPLRYDLYVTVAGRAQVMFSLPLISAAFAVISTRLCACHWQRTVHGLTKQEGGGGSM